MRQVFHCVLDNKFSIFHLKKDTAVLIVNCTVTMLSQNRCRRWDNIILK